MCFLFFLFCFVVGLFVAVFCSLFSLSFCVFRRSNLGTVFSDRFGLQSIYNRRKAALFGQANEAKIEVLEPTDQVPSLDPKIFTEKSFGLLLVFLFFAFKVFLACANSSDA